MSKITYRAVVSRSWRRLLPDLKTLDTDDFEHFNASLYTQNFWGEDAVEQAVKWFLENFSCEKAEVTHNHYCITAKWPPQFGVQKQKEPDNQLNSSGEIVAGYATAWSVVQSLSIDIEGTVDGDEMSKFLTK